MDLPHEYVRLGLAFDRLQRGWVDAYTGPVELRAAVENGPAPQPADLVDRAALLLGELSSCGLEASRVEFLRAQLTALETGARVLAGQDVGFVEQVESFFQVQPVAGDVEEYALAHAELDLLLPGDGPLLQRYTAYRDTVAVPVNRLEEAVREVSSLLRERARQAFPLAVEETVDYQIVTGKPWAGFNYYEGDFRSTVAINADLPVALGALPALVAHESYPGHHTERCRKQARLGGLPEREIWLVNTPENLIAEGLADLGLAGLGLSSWGALLSELYADLGIGFDGELGEQIARAAAPLTRVRQDVALLLHDRGGLVQDAEAHLARWALQSPRRTAKTISFLTDPLWRAYICTYVEGEALLSAWLDARPAGQPVGDRFVRLLDEPMTPAGLRASLA